MQVVSAPLLDRARCLLDATREESIDSLRRHSQELAAQLVRVEFEAGRAATAAARRHRAQEQELRRERDEALRQANAAADALEQLLNERAALERSAASLRDEVGRALQDRGRQLHGGQW